jgi:hypothetical protein
MAHAGPHLAWHEFKAGGFLALAGLLICGVLAFTLIPVSRVSAECAAQNKVAKENGTFALPCQKELDEGYLTLDVFITLVGGAVGVGVAQLLVEAGIIRKETLGIND